MSGIAGMWRLTGAPISPEQLEAVASPTRHRGLDGERYWLHGDVALVSQQTRLCAADPLEPAISEAAVVVWDGRLDNRANVLRRLSNPATLRHAADVQLVLAAFERFGADGFRLLRGDFAFAVFDRRERTLYLVRDVIGIRPLYYCRTATAIVFSSEIKGVLAGSDVACRPCDDAVADALLPANFVERELTLFDQVHRVIPGTAVVHTGMKSYAIRHDEFDPVREIQMKSRSDYAAALREHFVTAVRRRIRGSYPVSVLVSGGVDSTAVLSAADQFVAAGSPGLHAVSGICETPAADESSFLKVFELRRCSPVQRVRVRNLRHFVEPEELAWRGETMELPRDSLERMCDAAQNTGSRVLLTGYFGDQVMASQAYMADLARSLHWRSVRRHLSAHRAWFSDAPPEFFTQQFRLDFCRSIAPQWCYHVARRFRGRSADLYPRWFSREFRARALARSLAQGNTSAIARSHHARVLYQHLTSSCHLARYEQENKWFAAHGLQNAHPFTDRDLSAFVMAIPGDVVMLEGVPKGLFREAMRGILPEPIRLRKWKADPTELLRDAAEHELPFIESLLTRDCLGVQFGYLDAVELARGIREAQVAFGGPQFTTAMNQVMAVAGLEIWLQAFFARSHSDRQPLAYNVAHP